MGQKLILFFAVIVVLGGCKSMTNRSIFTEKDAKQALMEAGIDTSYRVINRRFALINDDKTAIEVAESILFEKYGKDNILKQKPYTSYFINNHWVISGSLPLNYVGGTFLIILDATDRRVVKISHGK